MRWPLTLRSRLDDRDAEIRWLKSRVEYLEDQLTRVRRKSEGMPEEPKERAAHAALSVPDELIKEIRRYGTEEMQRVQIREAKRRVRAGEATYESILADLRRGEDG